MAGSHGGDDLIAAIYDAVIDPSRWDGVVKRIVEATKSFSGNLVLQQADAGSLTALYNVDLVIADAYAQTYYKNDPLAMPAWSIAPGEVRACSYTQTECFRASAYYNEFVRPQGWVDLVATGLVRTPNAFSLLAVTRSPDAVWVEPPEWRLLETLAPHLQRAAAVHALLARTRATANSLAAAAGFAVFVLTGNCRVLFANPKAEDLVRHQMGLRYERGRRQVVLTIAKLFHNQFSGQLGGCLGTTTVGSSEALLLALIATSGTGRFGLRRAQHLMIGPAIGRIWSSAVTLT
jgi:hypothetical protein